MEFITHHFEGACHCGAIKFAYSGETINQGLRCNCSICRRKAALMSNELIPMAKLKIDAKPESMGCYQFGNGIAKHYFCKICGIYTHHETARAPGACRVNLGCIDDLDTSQLDVKHFDGKNLL